MENDQTAEIAQQSAHKSTKEFTKHGKTAFKEKALIHDQGLRN